MAPTWAVPGLLKIILHAVLEHVKISRNLDQRIVVTVTGCSLRQLSLVSADISCNGILK